MFETAEALGEARVRRIYGDFSNGRLASWSAAIRNFAIVPYQQSAHARCKNATDIALAIDAVDQSYRARLDGFVVVSSDSDSTRLAQRLREGGFAVYGSAKAGPRGRSAGPASASRSSEKRRTDRLPVPNEAPDGGGGMSDDTRNDAPEGEAVAEKLEDARRNRTIRFSDSEWEEVRRAALLHERPPAEFVRETILALARNPQSSVSDALAPSLVPLIERMFRYTWFLATEKRDAMVREGREDEVDALVAEARALQDSLNRN